MREFTIGRAMRAVRALGKGESYTAVLFDRQAYGDQPNGQSSLRVIITRSFTGGYEAELQEFNSRRSGRGEWSYFGCELQTQLQDLWLTYDDIPAVLGYYSLQAEQDRRRADETKGEEASSAPGAAA